MTGLESKIFDFIQCNYKVKFLGSVKVEESDGEYCLLLTLNNYMVPMQICYQGTSEDFEQFIYKELIKRNLVQVDYYKIVLQHGQEQEG